MIKLWEHPLSPFAQKVKLALYEKQIPFEATVPAVFPPQPSPTAEAEFARANPRLEVPTLIDGDTAVFDSTVILEYLDDKWPTPTLLPAGPAARAEVRMIEELCDTYYEAITWSVAEIRFFGRAGGALADGLLARAERQIAGANAWLERRLGDRPYFTGDRFGRGDVAVQPFVAGAAFLGYPPAAGSKLAAWMGRVQERDGVQRCTAAAMQAVAGFQQVGELVKGGHFKREYRDHRLEWMMRSGGAQIVLDGMAKDNIRFAVELS